MSEDKRGQRRTDANSAICVSAGNAIRWCFIVRQAGGGGTRRKKPRGHMRVLLGAFGLLIACSLSLKAAAQNTSFYGGYDVFPLGSDKRVTGFMIRPSNPGFFISGMGQTWTGQGQTNLRTGYYNWKFSDGRSGRTDFQVNPDGSLQGHAVGSGVDFEFTARHVGRASGPVVTQTATQARGERPGSVGGCTEGDENQSPDTVISSCTKLLDDLRRKQESGTLSGALATPEGIAGAFRAVYFRRAKAYLARSHNKGNDYALEDLNKAIDLAQSFKVLDVAKDYRGVRGCVLADMAQQLDLALSDIATALEGSDASKDSNYVATMLECRGDAYLGKGLPARAAQDFSASLKLQPNNQEVAYLLGVATRRLANLPSTEAKTAPTGIGGQGTRPPGRTPSRPINVVCIFAGGDGTPYRMTLRIDSGDASVQVRVPVLGALLEYVDGRTAPPLVQKFTPTVRGQNLALAISGWEEAHPQTVSIDANAVRFGYPSAMSYLDRATGHMTSDAGNTAECLHPI